MTERKRKFDINILGKAQFRPSDGRGAESNPLLDPVPPAAAELLRTFKGAPRKPQLVSEIAAALGRAADNCVDAVVALVKAGSLDLLQRAEGGNHLVTLTSVGRTQVEIM